MYFGDLLDTCDKTIFWRFPCGCVMCLTCNWATHDWEQSRCYCLLNFFYRQFMPMIELIQIIIKKNDDRRYIHYVHTICIEYRPWILIQYVGTMDGLGHSQVKHWTRTSDFFKKNLHRKKTSNFVKKKKIVKILLKCPCPQHFRNVHGRTLHGFKFILAQCLLWWVTRNVLHDKYLPSTDIWHL